MRTSLTIGRAAATAVIFVMAARAANMSGWTDRKEYDLVLKMRLEASPQKRLQLLNEWKQQYPQSEMRQARRELFLAAYQDLEDTQQMFDTAREMVAEQPANLVGVYWCTLLTPELKDPKPEILDTGLKAATRLLSGLDTYFAASQKPAGVADAVWQKQRAEAELLALRTTGYVQWKTADVAGAQKSFTAYLQKDPRSAEVMSWLGYVLASDNQPIAASWQLMRAAASHDDEAMPDAWRFKVEQMAERLYTSYHGDTEGLDKLKDGAVAAPFPPADYKVESAAVVRERKEDEALTRQDPELAAWVRLYKRLSAEDAEKYFLDEVKGHQLTKLRGTVVECDPPAKPSEIVVGLGGPGLREVTIKVSVPYTYAAAPGSIIEFQGTPDTFVKDPFHLTVLADQENIFGWPEPPVKPKR